jgi:hypothetical protein
MIETLDRKPGQIEVRSHAARFWRCFQNFDCMPCFNSVERRGKTHRPRPNNYYASDNAPHLQFAARQVWTAWSFLKA